mmetsp:Transcript_23487/g.41323  ORF Transcript_23487/g.41323 Transcript_23487/m.41323 type:complete len:310 (+) Transcript_23487:1696-2625(+)
MRGLPGGSDTQTPTHDGLLRMQPVFSLVKDHRMRAIHHFGRRLVVAVGGQAVHEQAVILGLAHQFCIHLIAAQLVVPPLARGLRIVHRHPGVCHHKISTFHGNVRIALCGIKTLKRRLGVQRLGAGEHEIKVKLFGRMGKAGKNVVAIPAPHNLFAFDRAIVFLERHDVRHDLARVRAVGQPVDDRHRGVFGHLKQRLFLKRADHDQVHITAEHAGGVGDGFAVPKLHIAPRQDHGFSAHLAYAHVKGNARPGGWFFKDQRYHMARQRLVVVRRTLGTTGPRRFHGVRVVDDLPQVRLRCCMDIEEMGH